MLSPCDESWMGADDADRFLVWLKAGSPLIAPPETQQHPPLRCRRGELLELLSGGTVDTDTVSQTPPAHGALAETVLSRPPADDGRERQARRLHLSTLIPVPDTRHATAADDRNVRDGSCAGEQQRPG